MHNSLAIVLIKDIKLCSACASDCRGLAYYTQAGDSIPYDARIWSY
jgi:hypothetical protein